MSRCFICVPIAGTFFPLGSALIIAGNVSFWSQTFVPTFVSALFSLHSISIVSAICLQESTDIPYIDAMIVIWLLFSHSYIQNQQRKVVNVFIHIQTVTNVTVSNLSQSISVLIFPSTHVSSFTCEELDEWGKVSDETHNPICWTYGGLCCCCQPPAGWY